MSWLISHLVMYKELSEMHQFPILVLITFWLVDLPCGIGKSNVFSVDLIHRDSVLSPLYDPSLTSSECLRKSVLRSFPPISQINSSLKTSAKYIETPVIFERGDYLMKISIGHSYEVVALASTKSDFVWVNCDSCRSSYPQDGPFYNRNDSTKLPPDNELCQALGNHKVIDKSEICRYKYSYGKGESTSGILLEESFFLGSVMDHDDDDLPNKIAFGCSEVTEVNLDRRVQGIIGLGPGKLSLVSQLGNRIESRFSYCLVPTSANNPNRKIKFGYVEENLQTRSVNLPFKVKDHYGHYYLTLEAVSVVGGLVTKISPYFGDTIIDLGTPMTLLHSTIYIYLRSLVLEEFQSQHVIPVSESSGTLDLCFDRESLVGVTMPEMRFHFKRQADIIDQVGILVMKKINLFVKYGDLTCLAIASYDGPYNVLGNIAQLNFQVDYDLNNKLISFTPKDCDKF